MAKFKIDKEAALMLDVEIDDNIKRIDIFKTHSDITAKFHAAEGGLTSEEEADVIRKAVGFKKDVPTSECLRFFFALAEEIANFCKVKNVPTA